MKMWSSQLYRNLSNCKISLPKKFGGFNGIPTRGLCVRAAVFYLLSYEDPYNGKQANLLSSTRERNETQNEMMRTAGIQMKWVCDHRRELQFKQ